MANFSTGDKIGLYGLLFAFIAIVISLTTPEIRKYLGLENDTSTTDELTDKLSKKEIAYILIARGIQEGTLTQKEIDRWIRTLDDNNAIQIIDSLYFVDQTIHGIVNKNEIDELYDKKVKGGFNPPEPLELDCDNKLLYVNTCREYFKIPDNCGPSNGYMEKELHWYDISCTILKAVKDGIRAKKSCLPQNLLEELPQSFINIGFSEEGETTEIIFRR
ncbi:MAG: hypothetical protein IPL27_20055 [Lewinellaceae bacterium]|nr:hypothetical protein [Lewinellaceae bacterium]